MTVTTDASGRFEFDGLLDSSYDLAAFVDDSLHRGDVKNVPAGARGIEIVVNTNDVWPEVRGRVVSRDGAPPGRRTPTTT